MTVPKITRKIECVKRDETKLNASPSNDVRMSMVSCVSDDCDPVRNRPALYCAAVQNPQVKISSRMSRASEVLIVLGQKRLGIEPDFLAALRCVRERRYPLGATMIRIRDGRTLARVMRADSRRVEQACAVKIVIAPNEIGGVA